MKSQRLRQHSEKLHESLSDGVLVLKDVDAYPHS